MHTLTRRSVGLLSASALAWIAVRKGLGSALRENSYSLTGGSRPLLTAPVRVPAAFLGMHAHRWPSPQPGAPAPTYSFGTARSHDHDGTRWNQIHTAPGEFEWTALDSWVDTHSAARRKLIYTLYGTPAWLSATPEQRDLYGNPGGASAPNDLSPLREFIAALVSRYNGDGQSRVGFVEAWNEPHFEGESRDFWTGSATQLVGVGRAVHETAKRADPNIRMLSPGFVGELTGPRSLTLPLLTAARRSSLWQYLTAPDGAGGRGFSWCDGIAFHTYNVALEGANLAAMADIARLNELLGQAGIALPLYNTECGFVAPHPFRSLSPREQAGALRRCAVLQAACGVQTLCFYAHDDDLIGNPSQHAEIAAALGDVHLTVAGATLHQVSLGPDGSVQFTTDAGAFTW